MDSKNIDNIELHTEGGKYNIVRMISKYHQYYPIHQKDIEQVVLIAIITLMLILVLMLGLMVGLTRGLILGVILGYT